MRQKLKTNLLIVGGGVGATATAIQAGRMGINTIIVTEFCWLGGMLTSAGVSAPDGHELSCFQSGLWGSFLKALKQRHSQGLDNSWVSMFSFLPSIGASIFEEWLNELSTVQWIKEQSPVSVLRKDKRILGVIFPNYEILADLIVDGTELGDLLALGDVPYRWGWELFDEFNEPSAPLTETKLMKKYPIQSPTWVVLMKDFGEGKLAPEITPPDDYNPKLYEKAWENYGSDYFMNYGRLPDDYFMINWPIFGNDYGENVNRLISHEGDKQEFLESAYRHSLGFAYFIQSQINSRYGLAENMFPHGRGKGAFALHPYYRESRRLIGKNIVTEQDILPVNNGCVGKIPVNERGEVTVIAMGNYANDHHYPEEGFKVQPKSMIWGGRWTGTGFMLPLGCVIPESIEGLLVCEKNISVSHIANGCTRLQPMVMGIGQAVGVIAGLSLKQGCLPHEVSVREVQEALLTDSVAPCAIIPLYNLAGDAVDRLYWQRYYLDHPNEYPLDGNCPCKMTIRESNDPIFSGKIQRKEHYLYLTTNQDTWQLVTLDPWVNLQFSQLQDNQSLTLKARVNPAGKWLVVTEVIEN